MVKIPIVDQVMSLVRKKGEPPAKRPLGREDRLRVGLDHAPVGVAFATPEGQWLYVNERFGKIIGYTSKELSRISFPSLTHIEDVGKELALIKRLLNGDIESYRIEKRVMAKTGRYRTLEVLATLARARGGGSPFLIYVTDEPQPSKRHEPTRESDKFMMQLIEHLEELAVIRTDDRGNITGWNAGATNIFGYSRDEIVGKNRRVLYRDADSWEGRSTQQMKNVAESGRVSFEDWRVTKDGRQIWVNTSITPYRSEGVVKGYVEIVSPQAAVEKLGSKPAPARDTKETEKLRAELEKEKRTSETLRSAVDDFRHMSEESMNELRIITVALRKEIDRRKAVEDELAALHEQMTEQLAATQIAPAPPPPAPEPEVEEEIRAPAVPPETVWTSVLEHGTSDILLTHSLLQSSGTLLFRWQEARKEIFFEKGKIVSCASNDPSRFLTQRLQQQGTISEEARRRALEIKKETDLPLGRILIILEAISEEQLVDMMRAKVEDEIAEVLGWTNGEWAFDDAPVPSLKLVPLRLEVEQLLDQIEKRTQAVSEEPAPAEKAPEGSFVASTKSGKVHRPDCKSARRITDATRRTFLNEEDAVEAGFEKCRQCFKGQPVHPERSEG